MNAGADPGDAVALVVPTIGRVTELGRLLRSLTADPTGIAEIVIVDQNPDGRLDDLLRQHGPELPLKVLRTGSIGASAARNRGAAHATAPILAFPDDDSWFPSGTVEAARIWLSTHPEFGAVCGMSRDEEWRPSVGRWHRAPTEVSRANVWTTTVEFATFLRRDVFEAVGGFDAAIGPGAGTPYGAHEIDDLALRLLARGVRVRYEPSIVVQHDAPVRQFGVNANRRALAYGRGRGFVMRRHRYPVMRLAGQVARTATGSCCSMARGRRGQARYRMAFARGIVEGWRGG